MSDQAKKTLASGERYPYDADDDGMGVFPTSDWARKAALGVITDLTDRRQIKWGFDEIDHDTRKEIVATLTDIIRTAYEETKGDEA